MRLCVLSSNLYKRYTKPGNYAHLQCVCIWEKLYFTCMCACVCVASPNQQGSLSDGGEGEEEQEASRAVRSRHCRNIWQRLTLTHKHTHTHITPWLQTHTHWPVFVLLFLRERKGKWHQAHHVRPMRQMREGVRTLADTEPCYIKLGTGLLWAPLPNYVCESVHMYMRMLACSSVCELSICALLHQGVSLQKEIITYLTAEKQSIMSRGSFTASQSL